MSINIQALEIWSEETPREILAADFKSLGGELPIRGGWGYSQDNAVVIDKEDPVAIKCIPFDGVSIEYVFIEKRIFEELIIFRPENSKCSGIKWQILEQRLVENNNRTYDVFLVEVTATPDVSLEDLHLELNSNNGFTESEPSINASVEENQEKTIHYKAEYWFDITSFYGI